MDDSFFIENIANGGGNEKGAGLFCVRLYLKLLSVRLFS